MIDWDSYTAALGANIRAERSRAGISQKALAERMCELGFGWQYQTVGKIEHNNRPLLVTEVLALCMAIGVSVATLMGAAGCAVVWEATAVRRSA